MDNYENIYPKIGTGVMVWKDGKILLGKRKGSHGAGSWSFPGGKLEYGETLLQNLHREVIEETGIEIENIRFNALADELEHMPKHFVNLTFVADWKSGEARVCEPDKCEKWNWFTLDNLPSPLFPKTAAGIEAYKINKKFIPHEEQ